jgi:(p)ppGpp synthase/HD superfamily hydrolase
MSIIVSAASMASYKHRGQFRKNVVNGIKVPYFVHLARVAGETTVYSYGHHNNESIVAAAWLHDIVEDTDMTEQDLREELDIWEADACANGEYDDFAKRVGDIVMELTNASMLDINLSKESRKVRKAADMAKLAGVSQNAKVIKLIDRLDNLRDFAMSDDNFKFKYAEETEALLEVIGDASYEYTKQIKAIINIIRCDMEHIEENHGMLEIDVLDIQKG